MKCKTCHHPQRHVIDLALLTGTKTYEALSDTYGLSISSLFRHKRHLESRLSKSREQVQHLQRQDLLFQFDEFLQEARAQIRFGKEEGNNRHVLQALREGTRIVNFINKMDLTLDPVTTYYLMASPHWPGVNSLYPTAPEFRVGIRQTLSRSFFDPCPELTPDPELEARDQAAAQAADRLTAYLEPPAAPESSPQPATLSLAALQSLDLHPDLLTMLQEIENHKPSLVSEPKKNREKSAKNAPEITLSTEKSQPSQSDTLGEKNPPQNPQNAAAGAAELSYEDYLREKAEAEAFLNAPNPELTPEPTQDQPLGPQS